MKVYRGFQDPALHPRKRCVAIGIFDGVHRAHQLILRKTMQRARETGALSTVLTFDPHPVKILSGNKKNPPILMSLEHRLQKMKFLGLDEAVVVNFNKRFSRISREDFLWKYLLKKMGMIFLAIGHDFRFGKNALGDAVFLSKEAGKAGFKIEVFKPLKDRKSVISSTRIRHLVESGRLDEAGRMLGRPVSIYGTVVKGKGRGRKLGFPTANVDPHHETLPPQGVYAVTGQWGKRPLFGVLHLGQRPTFGEKQKTVEVHWLDWKANLYGRDLEVFFVKKIRPIQRFSSALDLKSVIQKDIQSARRTFLLYITRINQYNLTSSEYSCVGMFVS